MRPVEIDPADVEDWLRRCQTRQSCSCRKSRFPLPPNSRDMMAMSAFNDVVLNQAGSRFESHLNIGITDSGRCRNAFEK